MVAQLGEDISSECEVISLAIAVGMIETAGVPAAIAAADEMCKAAQVTLVGYENTDLGQITVLIRGAVAEVEVAVAAGLAAIAKVNGGEVLSHHIIARPDENLEYALPLYHSAAVAAFDQEIRFPPPLSP
jgi:carbon dioxide concentrating mechanism protein CcmK